MAFLKSPTVIGIVTFLVIALGAKNVIDGLYTVGVQQGYAPEQPIAFSHKIHAGQYEIGCQYCHTGVEIGKSANIPSVNICMNCHSQIKTDSPEIQKLYAAQESGQPIEWVRIHNLPDLAYFNHSQHVKVGGRMSNLSWRDSRNGSCQTTCSINNGLVYRLSQEHKFEYSRQWLL